jgi:hypothetical protein
MPDTWNGSQSIQPTNIKFIIGQDVKFTEKLLLCASERPVE